MSSSAESSLTPPETFKELFEFYNTEFKPLYHHFEAVADVPQELFFETTAALDHLSRIWVYQAEEKATIRRAAAHLKRACFDGFKIILAQTKDKYDELIKVDLGIIDNGDFSRNLRLLWHDIEEKAIHARESEGDSNTPDKWHDAFDAWIDVYEKCSELNQNYYLNTNVKWARSYWRKKGVWWTICSFIFGIIIGFMANALYDVVKSKMISVGNEPTPSRSTTQKQ